MTTGATDPLATDPIATFSPTVFAGTTALVTGGGTGIGRATALGFARCGGNVVIASRDPEHLVATATDIEALGAECLAHPVNIRDVDTVEALRDAVVERFGGIDFLVNNAGGQFPAAPGDITDNGWRAVIDLNLNGTWNMISRFVPILVERNGGAIVNVVHLYSYERPAPFAHSGAARAGVVQLSYSLAHTLARSNVRVNALAPGTVDTFGMQTNEADVLEELHELDDFIQRVIRGIPSGRLGEPDEVAAAILFLCSPAGRWVTGTTLRVDGGEYGADTPMEIYPDRSW